MKIIEFITENVCRYIGIDGLMHFCISSILAFLISIVTPSWAAFLIVVVIGVAKEFYDKRNGGCCELKDFVCDLLGSVIGAF